jgi:uncharacterized protein YecT (DUF1311 family)
MNKADELLKLKELLDLGIINENDFNIKKVELFNKSNTVKYNSDSIKDEEIIIGKNEKECPFCKFIIEKECETCKYCDYDFINNKISNKIDSQIDNNNFKKYIPVFFVIVIFIFIGTWFFKKNNSNSGIMKNDAPKVAKPDSHSTITADTSSTISLSADPTASPAQGKSIHDSSNENNGDSGLNQIELNIKSGEDYKIADRNLNMVYKKIISLLNETEKKELILEQRNWIKYRDKHCDESSQDFKGGTMYTYTLNSCLIEITNNKVNELNNLLVEKQ